MQRFVQVMLSCGLTTGSYVGRYIVGCVNRHIRGRADNRGEGGGGNPPSQSHPNHQNHLHLTAGAAPVDHPYTPFQYESKASRGLPHLNLSHFLHSLMTGIPLADFITEERPDDGSI